MTIAIIQPYIFPYLGYYQLVNAVDTFVFFDDVNFISKGWINRNQLLQDNKPYRFTVPLSKSSQNKFINEIQLADYNKWRKDFLRLIELNYAKAPQYNFIFNWLKDFLFNKPYLSITELASDSIRSIANLLGSSTTFQFSSSISYKIDDEQNGQMKILAICKLLNAAIYINPRNGEKLYNREQFKFKNVALNFINMDTLSYKQLKGPEFIPNLSIIDILMFNSLEETNILLGKYQLS